MIDLPVSYLIERSQHGLREARYKRTVDSANCRKRMLNLLKSVIEDWITAKAEEEVLDFWIERGPEFMLKVLEDTEAPKVVPLEPSREENPPLKKAKHEFWRSEPYAKQRRQSGQ